MPKKQSGREPQKVARSLTDVEWTIMDVIWKHQPCAAGTVQELLVESHGWKYSTVKTTMDRMVDKGLLATESIRNLKLFKSLITRDDAKRMEIQQCLRRAFQGAFAPMIQFLVGEEQLSAEELDELRRLIKPNRKHESH